MKELTLFDFEERVEQEPELPYYDHIKGELKGSQIRKAKKLVKLELIRPKKDDIWDVLPIEGYNTRTYTVSRSGDGWCCNCQYNRTKGKICSHILAVWLYEGFINLED